MEEFVHMQTFLRLAYMYHVLKIPLKEVPRDVVSSLHVTYKPIGERFAYGRIPMYANLSPIGLYVSRDEDSLEGSSL